MQILPYDPKVDIIWSTPNPMDVVTQACSTTQKGIFSKGGTPTPALIQFLYGADHGNPLEHAIICVDISQISRACADQLRTHRTCSPTMSSTHYQVHTDYPHRVPIHMARHGIVTASEIQTHEALSNLMLVYTSMLARGTLKEDARQILPLSIEVRYMLTINARSLAHLIKLRSCYRNTIETILCANRLWQIARTWFPELFDHVGKACDFEGCREGKMRCDKAAVAARLSQYD